MFQFLRRLRDGGHGVPDALSGGFDLKGDSIVGWVQKLPFMTGEGTRVEVLRRGSAITGCDAGPHAGEDRLPFSISMLGHFTASELAREAVSVVARTRRGDTGVLKLNGATHMDLIRVHLGVPEAVVFDLDFSRAGNARPSLGKGWCGADADFTWTDGDTSVVRFPRPAGPGPYLLRLRFGSFITPSVPRQELDILVDDATIANMSAREPDLVFHEVRVDAAYFAGTGPCRLWLHHPLAAAPADPGQANDGRRLAFSFRRIKLVRVLQDAMI